MKEPTPMYNGDERFEAVWDGFVKNAATVSPFFRLNWVKYQIAYSGDKLVANRSFVLMSGEEPVAICPLIVEEYEGVRQISYRGEYLRMLRAPLCSPRLSESEKKRTERVAFEQIDNIARVHGAAKTCLMVDPLAQAFEGEKYNYLTKYGFYDCSMQTRLIDLRLDETELWKGIRHSYTAIINKGLKAYTFNYVTGDSDVDAKHANYVEMHHRAAGRITRPMETFELQKTMLKSGEAVLVEALAQDRPIAYNFYLCSGASAYYASSADEPDFSGKIPIGHAMQWSTLVFLKSKGICFLELDNQYYGDQFWEHPSDKEVSISLFKAGFGGTNFPLFRGMKFYSESKFEEEVLTNLRTSKGHIYNRENQHMSRRERM